MGIFRPTRERRGKDPFLLWKMLLFGVAAVFGLAGMATENGWLIALALATIAAGLLLRFLSRPRSD